MPEQFIPFTGFRPGASEHGNGLLRAENALPLWESWRSLPAYTVGGTALSTTPILGSYVHIYPSGMDTALYVGDAQTEFHGFKASLRTYAGTTFTDISRGGGYAAGAAIPAGWHFASFGGDVWAANWYDPIQRRTNNAGNFANGAASTFSPVARDLIVVREFLVAISLNQAGRYVDEFAWSDINDATWWDTLTTAVRPESLAGSKIVRSRPGQLLRGVGGEYGRLFKRRSIFALQFTGGSDVFRLDEISGSVGLYWPGSLVECRDGSVRFWGGDAFYKQEGFGAPERISPESLNSMLLDYELDTVWNYAMDRAWPTSAWHEDLYMQSWQSQFTDLVFWAYRSKVGVNPGRMERILVHDPVSGEWDILKLGTSASEGLSTLAGSPVNTGGGTGLLADVIWTYFDGANVARNRFDGASSMSATFATQRFQVTEGGGPGRITGILPVFSTPPVTGHPDYRLTALPAGTQIHLIIANDPSFVRQVDADGAQVSPRYESHLITEADDWGWVAYGLEGTWGVVVVEWPAGATNFRGFPGVRVRTP